MFSRLAWVHHCTSSCIIIWFLPWQGPQLIGLPLLTRWKTKVQMRPRSLLYTLRHKAYKLWCKAILTSYKGTSTSLTYTMGIKISQEIFYYVLIFAHAMQEISQEIQKQNIRIYGFAILYPQWTLQLFRVSSSHYTITRLKYFIPLVKNREKQGSPP